MRFAGRIDPGSGSGVFTGQSASRVVSTPRKAGWRSPADGPSSPPTGRGFVVSGVARGGAGGRGAVSITVARREAWSESTVSADTRVAESRLAEAPEARALAAPARGVPSEQPHAMQRARPPRSVRRPTVG